MTGCPATIKTTYVTTETKIVSTTLCPITEAEGSHLTKVPTADSDSYTSTILTAQYITVLLSAATVTQCPARSQTTYRSIQTVVAGTAIISAGALPTASSFTQWKQAQMLQNLHPHQTTPTMLPLPATNTSA